MSMIAALAGTLSASSSSGGGGFTITPIQASFGAWPGENSPTPTAGSNFGTIGTPYDPSNSNSFVNGLVTGHLVRRSYSGYWSNLGGFTNDHPEIFDGAEHEIISDPYIAFGITNRGDTYCMEWKGYWIAPSSGTWNFVATADDVVSVWLGAAALTPTDQNILCQTGQNLNSVIVVSGAWYPIRIRYQEWGGNDSMAVWAGPVGTIPQALFLNPERLCYNGLSDGY